MQRQLKQILVGSGSRGFTLVELLIIIAIIGIIAVISTPQLSKLSDNAELRSDARRLAGAMKQARMTAVSRSGDCGVVFGQAVSSVTYDYVVYVDSDADYEFDNTEEVLTRGEYKNASSTGNSIAANDEGLSSVSFNSRGIPRINTGGFGAGTVTLLGTAGLEKKVVLNTTGRIRIE